MRFLGEILVNLQSHDVLFAFEIDDRSSPTFVLFCDLQRKFPVWRFVSDDVSLQAMAQGKYQPE